MKLALSVVLIYECLKFYLSFKSIGNLCAHVALLARAFRWGTSSVSFIVDERTTWIKFHNQRYKRNEHLLVSFCK